MLPIVSLVFRDRAQVKAGQLLREFGTLDEIYRNLDAVRR